MVRVKMGGRGDRRELPSGKTSVKQVTRKPKGAKPEETEPKRSPRVRSFLGQSGKRKGGM